MTPRQIKAALAREALPLIAERRAAGWRGQQILDETGDDLHGFTVATLRVYWARHAKGRSAAEVLAEILREKLTITEHQRTELADRLRATEQKLLETWTEAYQRQRILEGTCVKNQETIAQLQERIRDLEKDISAINIMRLMRRR